MNKKGLLSIVCAVSLSLSIILTANSAVDAETILSEKEVAFREMQGFSLEPEAVKKARLDAKNNNTIKNNGVALSNDEVEELLFRVRLSRIAGKEVRDAAANDKIPGYAGAYIDTPKGELRVGLTDDAQQHTVMDIIPIEYKERVRFFYAEYTEIELQEKMDILTKAFKDLFEAKLGINDIGISVENNKIEVNVMNDTENVRMVISNLVESKYLMFNVTEPHVQMSATEKIRPVKAGIKVARLGSSGCTLGFVTSTGVITAGHCVSNGATLYQPSHSLTESNSLGTVTKWSGSESDSDAAFVPFSNSTQDVIYDNIPTVGILADNQYGAMIGDTVYTQGIATGVNSGVITNLDKNLISGSDYYYHQRLATVPVQGGDSGGPVYTTSLYDNVNFYNEGIISTGGSVNMSYSQIYRVLQTLGEW